MESLGEATTHSALAGAVVLALVMLEACVNHGPQSATLLAVTLRPPFRRTPERRITSSAADFSGTRPAHRAPCDAAPGRHDMRACAVAVARPAASASKCHWLSYRPDHPCAALGRAPNARQTCAQYRIHGPLLHYLVSLATTPRAVMLMCYHMIATSIRRALHCLDEAAASCCWASKSPVSMSL